MAVFQELKDSGLKACGKPDKRTLTNLLEKGQQQGMFETRKLTVPAQGLGSNEQRFQVVFRSGTQPTEELHRQVLFSGPLCNLWIWYISLNKISHISGSPLHLHAGNIKVEPAQTQTLFHRVDPGNILTCHVLCSE